jgi:hypothetical protein
MSDDTRAAVDGFWYSTQFGFDKSLHSMIADYTASVVEALDQMGIINFTLCFTIPDHSLSWIDMSLLDHNTKFSVHSWIILSENNVGIAPNRKDFLQKLLRTRDEYIAMMMALVNGLPQPIAEEISPEITFYWRIRGLLGLSKHE